MAKTVDIVIAVIFIIIIVVLAIYLFVAYRDGLWPFHPYVQPALTDDPDKSFYPIPQDSVTQLTPDQQACRQITVCTAPYPNSGGNADAGTPPPFCSEEPFKTALANPCPPNCPACGS